MEMNQLKLYSLSEAANAMGIGRDTLRDLIKSGRLGYILVGNSKRIAYQEMNRFQTDNTIRKQEVIIDNKITTNEIDKIFSKKNKVKNKNFNTKQILKNIMRQDDGNNTS